jgi:outer membrane protein insertion porin family
MIRKLWVNLRPFSLKTLVALSLAGFALLTSAAANSQNLTPQAKQPQSFQAAPGSQRIVVTIQVEGTQRIEPETIRTYMTVQPGDRFSAAEVNRSLKRLFETGFFSSVEILEAADNSTLIVRVIENPIVSRVAFEGNLRIDDDQLAPEVQTRSRGIYTRSKVQADVQRILDVYRRSGRYSATVEPKLINQAQNRVDVVFEVNEGSKTYVKRIVFVGNREFSDSKLRDEILTSEFSFIRFWASDDVYDPDRVSVDEEMLRSFYLNEGYADFRILSSVAELTPEKTGFVLTYTLEEGERYKFGKIEIESRIPAIAADTLVPLLNVQPGEWYNASLIQDDINSLSDRTGEAGFAFVTIRPRTIANREDRVVGIVYEVSEGPRVYVNRIEIEGNARTQDRVIRREFRLAEGDPFNTSKLRRTRERIRNLGFFESVAVTNTPTLQADRTDIKVTVTEQSTGELSFGAGFSTRDGPVGDVSIRERNLLGKGQDLRLGFQISARRQAIDLSFTEPFFLGRRLSAGFDLFRTEVDNSDESSFRRDTTGFRLRTGYAISERLRQNWTYTLSFDDVRTDIDTSAFIQASDGKSSTSSLSHSLTWDTRNSRFEPSSGFVLSTSNELAGLGGSERFIKNRVSGGWHKEVYTDFVLSVFGQAGAVFGLGQDTDINQRFFLGGDSLRGFEFAGVGPRDLDTDDAIGGNYFYSGTAELGFPLGIPDELGFRGRLFADAGSLFGLDNKNITKNGAPVNFTNSSALRASIGVGVSWRSPLGPVTVDFGFPILKEDSDVTQTVYFSFGTRF